MIRCKNCGAENSDYCIYCSGCGALLSSLDAVPDKTKASVSEVPVKKTEPLPSSEAKPSEGSASESSDPGEEGFRYIATDKNDAGSYNYDPARDRTLQPGYVPEDHSGDTVKAILIVGLGIAGFVALILICMFVF